MSSTRDPSTPEVGEIIQTSIQVKPQHRDAQTKPAQNVPNGQISEVFQTGNISIRLVAPPLVKNATVRLFVFSSPAVVGMAVAFSPSNLVVPMCLALRMLDNDTYGLVHYA